MQHPRTIASRRDVMIAGGACALSAVASGGATLAQDAKAAATEAIPAWQEAIRKVVGDARLIDGRIMLDVPEIAENGNVVPFVATVDAPMTEANHVRSLRLFATGNPQALIATFRFSSLNGKAMVSSRMRLAKSQDVIALAELGDGSFAQVKRSIKVTIGGCGG